MLSKQELYDELATVTSRTLQCKARFDKHCKTTDIMHNGTPCMLWIGYKDAGGYGTVTYRNTSLQAHIVGYLLTKRKTINVMDKLQARHLCGHSWCAQGDHIEMGTIAQQIEDKRSHGTLPMGEKHANSKLTSKQVEELINLKGSMSVKERASQFNVSEKLVYTIDSGHAWKHIPRPVLSNP